MAMLKKIFEPIYDFFDQRFKFGNVISSGEIAIQVGIDMDSTTTSDLFHMANIVGENGTVIGIEPSPINIERVDKVKDKYQAKIVLVQKATYSEKGEMTMQFGTKAQWNRLDNIPGERVDEKFKDERIPIEMDTIDNILTELNIPLKEISHINLTNNGAEFETLRGMKNLIQNAENLSIYAIAGRPGELGRVNGEADHTAIINLLKEMGLKVKFQRFSEKFWSGFVKSRLILGILKGRWNFGQQTPGVVMAKKGNKSFSIFESYN
ncbi:MAG: hypothetical protein COC01_05290 [Bacteroidetes bacterium]|nr:MAG: hypothetical protein COC01_05290 [Bacteroidota bacterium]